jgi:hypothetical protein
MMGGVVGELDEVSFLDVCDMICVCLSAGWLFLLCYRRRGSSAGVIRDLFS